MNSIVLEDLEVGRTETLRRRVTAEMIEAFAELSGDENPLHLDAAYAAATRFGQRIAHGMLSGAFISAVIGTRLPGRGCVYLSQSLRFRRPVRIGDVVLARATIIGVDRETARVRIRTVCSVDDTIVIEGEAVVLVARRAEQAGPSRGQKDDGGLSV